jgi:hypothetical protein
MAVPLAGLSWLAAGAAHKPEPAPQPFSTEKASFALKFKDELSPYRVLAAFVMPGARMDLEAVSASPSSRFAAQADAGRLAATGSRRWSWTAPILPGLARIAVTDLSTGEAIALQAFVLVPYHGTETLNGYRIGRYEPVPLRGDPAYRVPAGFVEVTPQNEDTLVAPHFRLGQFLCKQAGGHPRYLVLRERLLLKLERLLEQANEAGLRADTFHVMSGYRTPDYNRAIGNRTRYSRHCYGDAADIFIDQDLDGRIDDLDRDGRIGLRDGAVIYDLVERLSGEAWFRPFQGGMHLYPATAAHGPMVHVDARGRPVRW